MFGNIFKGSISKLKPGNFICIDINGCGTNPCHPQATCQDTIGSFTCTCDAGYSGNGFVCQGKKISESINEFL